MSEEEYGYVQSDPKKPYKMYAAIVAAMISSALSSGADFPVWFTVLLGSVIAGIAVYLTPNPLEFKHASVKGKNTKNDGDVPLF